MFLYNLPDKYNDALFRFRSVKEFKSVMLIPMDE